MDHLILFDVTGKDDNFEFEYFESLWLPPAELG